MMMQMLQAGGMPLLCDDVRGADESNPRGYFELDSVKRSRQDLSWLEDAPGKVVKVIHALLPCLPSEYSYQVIFMRRRMSQVLDSQYEMLKRSEQEGSSASRELLAKAFERQVGEVIDYLQRAPSMRLLLVEYVDVIKDAAGQAARINDFLGGRWDASAMATAVEPGLFRHRDQRDGERG